MGIILFAVIGGALAFFGGQFMGLYDAYGTTAPYVGAVIGAPVATALGFALRPRHTPVYRGPAL
jgi:hypothetical protein